MSRISDALLDVITPHLEASTSRPPLLFLSGAQGIGKSTALAELRQRLPARIAALSIDDVYLGRAARERLALEVHPLCVTRGPPGTHDLSLLTEVLGELGAASGATRLTLPAFNKAKDDRVSAQDRPVWKGRPDLILVDGWLMGLEPDPAAPTAPPLNAVEAEDPHGHWRSWQETQLARPYAALWDLADGFIHLDAPSFHCVRAWRLQQEAGNLGKPEGSLSPAETAWVDRFILHYQRLTERLLSGHRRPGAAIRVDANRSVTEAR